MECWLFKEWLNDLRILSLSRWFDWSCGCKGFLVGCIESEILGSWLVIEYLYRSIRSFIVWKIMNNIGLKWR